MNYWTHADQAELDVILWQFTGAARLHQAECAACRETWCAPLTEAWLAVETWLKGRRLLTKARWLRVLEQRDPALDRASPEGHNPSRLVLNDSHLSE